MGQQKTQWKKLPIEKERWKIMHKEEYITTLKLFNEKAEKLENLSFTKIVLFENQSNVSISAKAGERVNVKRKGPDEESIDAFVLTFRFFIQNNEKSSFENLEKIYEKLPIPQQKKDLFKSARKKVNEFLDSNQTVLQFKINNKYLSERHILDIFIYGGLSHAKEKKKKEYDMWMSDSMLKPLIENEFVYILGVILQYILYIKTLNEEVIKELEKPVE